MREKLDAKLHSKPEGRGRRGNSSVDDDDDGKAQAPANKISAPTTASQITPSVSSPAVTKKRSRDEASVHIVKAEETAPAAADQVKVKVKEKEGEEAEADFDSNAIVAVKKAEFSKCPQGIDAKFSLLFVLIIVMP